MTDASNFDYSLPEEAIAQQPVEPRHSSRLLDTRDLSDHAFLDLGALLVPGDLVVVNRTRVRAARLHGVKSDTGGAVEALLLRRVDPDRWEALVRPARRIRAGTTLVLGELIGHVLTDPRDGLVSMRIEGAEDVEEAIERSGEIPLPPYINERLSDRDRYQTIFADRPGSAAAPTAGLHFTPQVLDRLAARRIETAAVDLEVGIATFRPISAARIEDHVMHRERFRLPGETAKAIDACRNRGGRVVAIGTTTVRVLESSSRGDGLVEAGSGETGLYITPGHRFGVVDALVTNFHLPRSSLIVLVAAFMGPRWRAVYETAIRRGYRFLSFGDAMYCERAGIEK